MVLVRGWWYLAARPRRQRKFGGRGVRVACLVSDVMRPIENEMGQQLLAQFCEYGMCNLASALPGVQKSRDPRLRSGLTSKTRSI